MGYTELHEHDTPAACLPRLAGWHLAGVTARDGSILWGEILDATEAPQAAPQAAVSVTYRDGRAGGAPNGQLISLDTPNGQHRVVVSRSLSEGETCGICGGVAGRA